MKKIVSLVGALMVLTAGSALAGTNLGWTDCLGQGGTPDKTITCTNSAVASNHLFVSFTVPADIPSLGASDCIIDVQAPTTMGAWWLAGQTRFAAAAGPSTCPGWGDLAPNGTLLFGPTIVQTTPSRLRIRNVVVVSTDEEQLAVGDGTEYLANTLQLKFNAGTFLNAECVNGAAFAVPNLRLQQPGTLPETVLESPDLTNCATWRSGGAGNTCPNATPTRKATWGSIKALYR